ncbi:MAG: hypothetical protein JW893_07520 [Candidatus Omnitrophica bacterium]|nr:hypothetical protein [Candidatus Omnitrophota bacterium]
MVFLSKLIAIAFLAFGVYLAAKPQIMKKYLSFWQEGKRVYLAGVIRIVIGIVFLFASPDCRVAKVILVLGVLCLAGGILIFVLGIERIKLVLAWWEKRSLTAYRIIGGLTVLIGLLLVYAV